jgi:ubiquinone/menaquinone biosynthesis C-methylase UbiE
MVKKFRYNLLSRILRPVFYLLYHQFAWSYDIVAAVVSLGWWKRWIFSVIPFIPSDPILELGYGPGHLQIELSRQNRHAYGLDASPQMSRQAGRRLKRHKLSYHLTQGNAQALPFPDGAFSHVTATFPSEYIMDSQTLSEINRVLKPKGSLVTIPFAWITGKKNLERLAAWLFKVTGQAPDISHTDLDHLPSHPLAPFQKAGFQTKIEWLDIGSGCLLILQATKPG